MLSLHRPYYVQSQPSVARIPPALLIALLRARTARFGHLLISRTMEALAGHEKVVSAIQFPVSPSF
jgi:hypothetical protein